MAYIYKHIPFLFRPISFDIRGFTMPGFAANGGGGGGGGGSSSVLSTMANSGRGYYRRFPAIDGMNLSQHYSEFPDLLDTIRDKQRVLGEVGCSLSHYSLWKSHAKQPKSDMLLVFEDDVMFTERSLDYLNGTIAGLMTTNPRWDVIYIGGQWTPDYNIDGPVKPYFAFQTPRKESLERYFHTADPDTQSPYPVTQFGIYQRRNLTPAVIHGSRNVWFTPLFRTAGAYLVSKRGAKRLLEAVEKDTALFMKTPLDMWLLEMDFRGYIDAFDRFPHPFYQAGFEMVREPSHAKNDIHRTDFQTVKLPPLPASPTLAPAPAPAPDPSI